MIIPDVNLLVYAYDTSSIFHLKTTRWLEELFQRAEPVGLASAVILGFVRLLSNPKVVQSPAEPSRLIALIQELLKVPGVRLVAPGIRHLDLMAELFTATRAGSALTTDIHLAALAIEHGATLASNDTDFLRFRALKVVNPLE